MIFLPRRLPLLLSLNLRASSFEGSFLCPSAASFSTDIIGDTPILVRDFIHSALYHPNHGYFSKRPGSVGMLDKSIKFNQLQGRNAYLRHLGNLYKQNDIAWFTPVELFKPWYAHGIAEAILRTADLSVPLKIYEIGGGSGTCAKCIMDYMMLNAPAKVYNNMTYVSVEISPSLARKQLETLGEVSSHSSRFRVECRDAANRSGWGDVDRQQCWVIMLEKKVFLMVGDRKSKFPQKWKSALHKCALRDCYFQVLDNLPHDLIYSENQVSPWMEVWLEKQRDSLHVSELYKPLHDPLISCCVKILDMDKEDSSLGSRAISAAKRIWSKVFPHPRRVWLPTGCLQLMEVLHWALPKMSLIASDFSYLPDVRISGERAPLVSTKNDGRSVDYKSYLDAKGDADIFFPTDFWLLERIDHHCSGLLNRQLEASSSKKVKQRRTIVLDTASFMEEFGLPSKTRTKDGYNPLLDDFKNTKFYISVPTHNTK